MRFRWSVVMVLLCAGVVPARAAEKEITLQVGADRVIATTGSKGPVAFFSMAVEPGDYYPTLVRRETIAEVDAAGHAQFTIDTGVPFVSVWFAVDLKSGAVAVAAPDGMPLRRLSPPQSIVKHASPDDDELTIPFGYAEVFIVTKQGEVWRETGEKGGRKDKDKALTGPMRLQPSTFQRIAGADRGPSHLLPGDVVIAVKPDSLAFILETVAP